MPLYVKFGTIESEKLNKNKVQEVSWSNEEYYKEMNIPQPLLKQAEENDQVLVDGTIVKKYIGTISPDVHRIYNFENPDVGNQGGPVYV